VVIPLETLRDLYEFNYWARDRQLQACAALTPEQFLRPLGSSFSSVRDTLVHLLAVEWIWLERWRGESPTKQDAAEFAAEKFPTLESIRERWKLIEQGVRDYLRDLTEQELSRPLAYTNLQGQAWTYALWRVHFHVVNHQTYHRGQIATLLRQLGAPAVPIDYLVAQDVHFAR
jgi:uncharacterized damage-inducible protein DinB